MLHACSTVGHKGDRYRTANLRDFKANCEHIKRGHYLNILDENRGSNSDADLAHDKVCTGSHSLGEGIEYLEKVSKDDGDGGSEEVLGGARLAVAAWARAPARRK